MAIDDDLSTKSTAGSHAVDPKTASLPSAWQQMIDHIETQLPEVTVAARLRTKIELVSAEDGAFVAEIADAYCADWLQHRLHPKMTALLSQICGRPTQIRFIVRGAKVAAAART